MDMSLQERYAPTNACFGCGPANAKGLKVRSFPKNDAQNTVVAHWQPEPHHEAFPGILNGGIIGTLLDCHSNWTAAYHLMQQKNENHPPCTVTAEYTIKLLKPTPTKGTIELIAHVVESSQNKARVVAQLIAEGKVCASCEGVFIAVKPDHPAYHRW